jgi:hypothetical protein
VYNYHSRTPPKKRKLSGLSGLASEIAYNSLLKLKDTLVYEESEEGGPGEPAPEGFEQQIDTMLALLGSTMEGPQVRLQLQSTFH